MTLRNRAGHLLRSPVTLAAAALLVGVAIVWHGAGARAFNAVGGVLWVASAAAMVGGLRRDPRRWHLGALVLGLALTFAVVVRPSDGLIAIIAFGIGGGLIAAVGQPRAVEWGVLLPAIWLPVHLVVAIVRATYRAISDGQATVRTEPPPTTAVVPLLMVLGAWGGAILVARLAAQRQTTRRSPLEAEQV